MIIVKLTILLVVCSLLYGFVLKAWLSGNRKESIRVAFDNDYKPKYLLVLGFMVLLSIIGIFASVIWLLFFR